MWQAPEISTFNSQVYTQDASIADAPHINTCFYGSGVNNACFSGSDDGVIVT